MDTSCPGSHSPFRFWARPSDREDRAPQRTHRWIGPCAQSEFNASLSDESHQPLLAQNNFEESPISSQGRRFGPGYRRPRLDKLDVGPVACAKSILMHLQMPPSEWSASISGLGARSPRSLPNDHRRSGVSRRRAIPFLRESIVFGAHAAFKRKNYRPLVANWLLPVLRTLWPPKPTLKQIKVSRPTKTGKAPHLTRKKSEGADPPHTQKRSQQSHTTQNHLFFGRISSLSNFLITFSWVHQSSS